MPIRPQFRYLYPIDWRQLSALVRFERARGRCECCSRPHGQTVRHTGDGRWWDEADQLWRNGRGRPLPRYAPPAEVIRRTRVVLATAHRDHDPTHNAQANLRALCQRCHMIHDRPEHQRRRKATLWQRNRQCRAMGDLFTGPYQLAADRPSRAMRLPRST